MARSRWPAAPPPHRRWRSSPAAAATTTRPSWRPRPRWRTSRATSGRRHHGGQPDPHAQRRPARLRAARPRRQAAGGGEARAALGRRGRRVAQGGAGERRLGRARGHARREHARGAALVAGPARGDRRRGEGPRRARRGRPGPPRGLRRQRAALHRSGCARSTAAIARCIETIPPARRKLVTTHDALGAYAKRYGLEVDRHRDPVALDPRAGVGGRDRRAGADDPARAGARGVRRELGQRRRRAARSPARPGAKVSPPLWADALGPKGSSGATYIGSMEANTRTIAARWAAMRVATGRCARDRDLLRALHAARAGGDPPAGGARRRARRLDRPAAARVLHPLGRHRGVPGPRRRRAPGASRRSSRRSAPRWASRARASGSPATATRTPPPASCSSARWRSARCSPPTSTSPAPASTGSCSGP